MASYSLELDLQDPWFRPFTVHAELDRAHDGVKGRASCACPKAGIVESPCRFDRLSNHLHLGIGERRHIVPQGIDLRVIGARLISIQQLLNTWEEHHLWSGLPIFVVDEAVEQRAERRFYRCVLRAY